MADTPSFSIRLNRRNVSADKFDDDPVYAVVDVMPRANDEIHQRSRLNLCLVLDSSSTMHNFQLSEEEREYWIGLGLARDEMRRGEADQRTATYWSGQTLHEMQGHVRKPMSMAVSAVKHLLHNLGHGDRVSVVAFADRCYTVFAADDWNTNPEMCLTRLDELQQQLLPVDIGTGTCMAAALDTARDLINATPSATAIDRVVVVSDGIIQDRQACLAAIERLHGDDISVTAVGVADDFEEEFLMRIADLTRGAYYYASDINDIGDQLLAEFTTIKSTSYRQVVIAAQGIGATVVQDIFMVRPTMTIFEEMDSQGGWLRARVGDIPADVPTTLLVQLALEPKPAGETAVAKIELSWSDPSSIDTPVLHEDDVIKLNYTNDESLLAQIDPEAQDLVNRFSVYRLEREAHRAEEQGDIDKAKDKYGQATRTLLEMGEEQLAKEIESQAAELDSGDVDRARAKRIKATTRLLGV